MRTLDQVARHYRRIAPAYALLSRLRVWPPGFRPRVVAALDLRAGERVLDLGCGTGAAWPLLQRAVGPEGLVVGVDYTPEMLRRAPRSGASNAALVQADAAALPLAGEFDAALFCLSYFVIPDSMRALDAVWRLLRPGGCLVVADGKIPPGRGGLFPGRVIERLIRSTSFAGLLRSESLPALRRWLAARGAEVEWQEWFGGIFFLCRATKPSLG